MFKISKSTNKAVWPFAKKEWKFANIEHYGQEVHLMTGKSWESVKFYEALEYKKIALLPKHHFKQDFVIYEKFI